MSTEHTPGCHEGNIGGYALRLAYADPPYPGQARKYYGDHADFAGEVDHHDLLERLSEYDGWALSTSMKSLRSVLALCPEDVLVAAWWNTNAAPPGAKPWPWWFSWEPVIVRVARPRPHVRNVLACPNRDFYPRRGEMFVGQKPVTFCRWIFDLIGADPNDQFHDLFPGSGAVGRAWESWSAQQRLALDESDTPLDEQEVWRLAEGRMPSDHEVAYSRGLLGLEDE